MPDDDTDTLTPLVQRHAEVTAVLVRHLLRTAKSPEDREHLFTLYVRAVVLRMMKLGEPQDSATRLLLAAFGSLREGLQDNLEGEP